MLQYSVNPEYFNKFVLYALYDDSGQGQYIGVSKYDDLLALKDARTMVEWHTTFSKSKAIDCRILQVFDNKITALNAMNGFIRQFGRPPMNYGIGVSGVRCRVQCLETGQIFGTISEAAKHAGVSQSYMSKHLTGVRYHKFVKGLSYKKIF